MPNIKKLTKQHTELWKEYTEFLQRNNIEESDVVDVSFIYYVRLLNKNCLTCKPNLTKEECSMYDLTVDDDCNWIIADNDYGTIYVKLKNNIKVAFRCTNQCLKSKKYRFLNQWNAENTNISINHYNLLKGINFL
jgi:hypothetical protein